MLRYVFAGITPVHVWWREALRAVTDGQIDPLPIISHTLPLTEAPKGYELFDRHDAAKVILSREGSTGPSGYAEAAQGCRD
jgi:threonine dehydrogenase-like Zn-dependent dehydrogenase